jgi:hypothetical protein
MELFGKKIFKKKGARFFKTMLKLYIVGSRAHVGGPFGRRSRLVKVDFAFSLVKSEVQVAL